MGKPKEILHIYTYDAKFCEARPGDPPFMFPNGGTNCPGCKERDAAFTAKHEGWRERERKHIAKLEAGWAEEEKKKGTGS